MQDYPEMVEDIGTNETDETDETDESYIHSEEYYVDVWRDQHENG